MTSRIVPLSFGTFEAVAQGKGAPPPLGVAMPSGLKPVRLVEIVKVSQADRNFSWDLEGSPSTNRMRIRLLGGAAGTRENDSDTDTPASQFNSAEATLAASLEIFRFKVFQFSSCGLLYPSISDAGRFRIDSNSTVPWQVISNLYWSTNLYTDYDSRPPRSTPRSDYGVSSNFGWCF